jgi:hypothetical protein
MPQFDWGGVARRRHVACEALAAPTSTAADRDEQLRGWRPGGYALLRAGAALSPSTKLKLGLSSVDAQREQALQLSLARALRRA